MLSCRFDSNWKCLQLSEQYAGICDLDMMSKFSRRVAWIYSCEGSSGADDAKINRCEVDLFVFSFAGR